MVKLFCMVVGETGSAFAIDIDAIEFVHDLKKAIKAKNYFRTVDVNKLQLFAAKNDNVWLQSSTNDVKSLKKGNKTDLIESLIHEDKELQAEFGIGEVLNGMPDPKTKEIHILVVVPMQERRLLTKQTFSKPFRTFSEGIYFDFPHLSREELVEDLYQKVIRSQFVLLSSPAGSGKTSLLTLFVNRHPELNYIPIWFYHEGADPLEILASHGIDVIQRKCVRQDDKSIVFVLDDCQRQYRHIDFWTALIKGVNSWMPKHIRFIFSATHLLETDTESPVLFSDIPSKLTRNDFMINDEEAHQLINFDNGLPLQLRFPTLVKVIIRECNGHIASLRTSCNILSSHFSKAIAPVEEDVFSYYLSRTFVHQLARCFGTGHTTRGGKNYIVINCTVKNFENKLM